MQESIKLLQVEPRAVRPPGGRHDRDPSWIALLDRYVPVAAFSSKIGRKCPPIKCCKLSIYIHHGS